MKRGLKDALASSTSRTTNLRCKDYPDEKGTESCNSFSTQEPHGRCKDYPDEKGTESFGGLQVLAGLVKMQGLPR